MAESLKNKSVKGAAWSFADNIASSGITFLVGLVLARLLSPDEYGLIGIILLFITIFNGIIDSGFTAALIRKKDATDRDYNTVFVVNLAISVLLSILLFLCAPLISAFFKRPELTSLTQVMSVVLIINALSIVQNAVITKRIDFKTKTKASLISSVFSGIVGIGMALAGCGVWSLVGQQISKQSMNTLCLWLYNRWMPQFTFYWESFKELWNFGYKLLLSGLINVIWGEIYQVVIGKCYSAGTLGYFTQAKQYTTIFSSNLNNVIQKVSYPVLSTIQDDKDRLKEGYRRIIKLSMLLSFVLTLGMAAVAKPMILVLIGDQWLPCVPMLQILSFNMMLYPLHSLNLNILQVSGRSDLFLKLEIVKDFLIVFPIIAGIIFNIFWMLFVGFLTGGCVGYFMNSYYSGKLISYSSWEQLKDIKSSFLIAISMAAIVFLMNLLPINPFVLLPLQIFVGALYTIMVCEWRKPSEYVELKSIALSVLNKINNK